MKKNRSGKTTPEAQRARMIAYQEAIAEAQGDAKKIKKIMAELKAQTDICGAYTKAKGTVCIDPPYVAEDGRTNGRCWAHGGGATGPISHKVVNEAKAQLHPDAYKVYAINMERFRFTTAENVFYIESMNKYIKEYNLDLVNIILLDRALRNFFMNGRKEIAEENETVPESRSNQDFDTKALRYFQALGFDRKFVKSTTNSENPQKIDLAQVFMLQGSEDKEEQKPVIDDREVKYRKKLEAEKAALEAKLAEMSSKLPKEEQITIDEEEADDDE